MDERIGNFKRNVDPWVKQNDFKTFLLFKLKGGLAQGQ